MENRRMKNPARKRLEALGMTQVSIYQPQSNFVKNGRKLTRVAEECDPWLAGAAYGDRCYYHIADDPMQAAEGVILQTILPSAYVLAVEIGKLTEAIHAR